ALRAPGVPAANSSSRRRCVSLSAAARRRAVRDALVRAARFSRALLLDLPFAFAIVDHLSRDAATLPAAAAERDRPARKYRGPRPAGSSPPDRAEARRRTG